MIRGEVTQSPGDLHYKEFYPKLVGELSKGPSTDEFKQLYKSKKIRRNDTNIPHVLCGLEKLFKLPLALSPYL